ncbi:MAG TPA: hypothetical protein VN704_04990 [Verrucomicrobiae bacterium]|nr:hypothetical protein [Verrucomicrobiae bacterium]
MPGAYNVAFTPNPSGGISFTNPSYSSGCSITITANQTNTCSMFFNEVNQ